MNETEARRASGRRPGFYESRCGGLHVVHREGLDAAAVLFAIEVHRRRVAERREECEAYGPGSSVSRVSVSGLDLAVKWNHSRGLRGALSDLWNGSRARRAAAGALRVEGLGLQAPQTWATAESRKAGLVVESFLLTGFCRGADPLPAAAPRFRADRRRRRALVARLGETLGRLHAADLDHRDLKHSNLLVTPDDLLVLIDLDSLARPRRMRWRLRVRALGQLEAYARDLYPWLGGGDRLRFLRAYLAETGLDATESSRLRRDVESWAQRRLSEWADRPRPDRERFPMAPRRAEDEGAPEAGSCS